ncbi:MAG TPA: methyltransferase [Bryobacteraceae bacterium]
MSIAAPFQVRDVDAPALREAIAGISRAGYCEASVRERLGVDDLSQLNWRHLPIYRDERLTLRDPLALAIELFLLQGSLTRDELDRLLPAASRDVLLRTEILEIDNGSGLAQMRASLFPVGTHLIFSDHAWPELPHPGYTTVPYDHVMAIGIDSRQLVHATVRRPVHSALDLCTGSGIHALLASAHAERVTAVDINARAAACTRFNAQALGIHNLEVAVGDLFKPVGDERFDLITANPPFVPSPVNAVGFRDGGPAGEDVQKRLIAELPRHLAQGGIAQIVTELGERDGEPLARRLREWLGNTPIDIYVLRVGSFTPIQYAVGHAKGEDYGSFLESTRAWAGNLRAQGFSAVVPVLITFQWSDPECGPQWERIDICAPLQLPAGAEIEQVFEAERLARHPNFRASIEDKRLRRADPIARFDASLLGGVAAVASTQSRATRLGQALRIDHELSVIEQQLLDGMHQPVEVSTLIGLCREFKMNETSAIEAIRSLIRKGLIETR